jgi:hypothetical protein
MAVRQHQKRNETGVIPFITIEGMGGNYERKNSGKSPE